MVSMASSAAVVPSEHSAQRPLSSESVGSLSAPAGPSIGGVESLGPMLPSVSATNFLGDVGSLSVFLCSQCKLNKPVSMQVARGSQLWCLPDISSYQGLVTRWCKNQALKNWWRSMDATAKAEWFRKWQNLEAKRRYDFISFIERTIHAQETLEDEIDKHIPWSVYYAEQICIPGSTFASVETAWKEAVESCRAECKFVRGQWLLPRFEGVESRKRKRVTQEIELMRSANITDSAQMLQLWTSGQQLLDRFSSLTPVIATHTGISSPHVNASISDMPTSAIVQDVLHSAISREVIQGFFQIDQNSLSLSIYI